jgi:hypothetical protein
MHPFMNHHETLIDKYLKIDSDTCHILWKNQLDMEKNSPLYFPRKKANSYQNQISKIKEALQDVEGRC